MGSILNAACKTSNRTASPESEATLVAAGVQPFLAKLYASRGVTGIADMDTRLSNLIHFNQLLNATEMGERLADAIDQQEKIIVVADYDADGATACSTAIKGLSMMGHTDVSFIVPNRFLHGYGLSIVLVDMAHAQGAKIILTVDNGIASVTGVTHANKLGITVLITDHHLQGDELPDALIVNPNQKACSFPSKCLAGVGVAFYVLLATRAAMVARGRFTKENRPNLVEMMDIVALGTVADVVALDTNNRILVQQGINRIKAGMACAGIKALLKITTRPHDLVKSSDFGFLLGPRINAAGRLADMTIGIHCLLSSTEDAADKLAHQLDAINKERKEIEAGMQDGAEDMIEGIQVSDTHTIVLFEESWHQGVIGLLASRIKEKHNRPVFCFAKSEDGMEVKGSGRSIPSVHLRDALDIVSKKHPDLLNKFGGHAAAAGCSIPIDGISLFVTAFEAAVASMVSKDDMALTLLTDNDLPAEQINVETAAIIESAIWGHGFPAPAFIGDFEVVEQKVLKEKHLKLLLKKGATSLSSIIFNQIEGLPAKIRAVYVPELNRYNGRTSVQIKILEVVDKAGDLFNQ